MSKITLHFCVAGFENGLPVNFVASLEEINKNEMDCESYYALQEQLNECKNLEFLMQNPNKTLPIYLTRDSKDISGANIIRISYKEFNQLKNILK